MSRRIDPRIIGWMRAHRSELREAYRLEFGTDEPPAPEPLPVRGSTVGLTEKQGTAYRFICDYADERGHTPSYDEIGAALGLASKSGVHRIVTALEERGRIRRRPNRARAIEIVETRP
ncbi:LexA family protein [Antarcticirhabdus aurantiaca]|uniref:LexA family protein n=1 Tax=Antarcticirhabdus aurantiaca TaxID=2606717 RepID=UPI003F7075B4